MEKRRGSTDPQGNIRCKSGGPRGSGVNIVAVLASLADKGNELLNVSDSWCGSPLGHHLAMGGIKIKQRSWWGFNTCCVSKCVGGDGCGDGCACPPSWSCPTPQSQTLQSHTHCPHERCGSSRSLPSSFPRSWQRSVNVWKRYLYTGTVNTIRMYYSTFSIMKRTAQYVCQTYPVFSWCSIKVSLLSPPGAQNKEDGCG